MAPHPENSNWRIIAEQITVEMDRQKLSALINQLCAALDEEANRNDRVYPRPFSPPASSTTEPLPMGAANC